MTREDVEKAYINWTGCAQQKAWSMVCTAVAWGVLVRPKKCSRCGYAGGIEGHHPSYDKPLDVIWLCLWCHQQEHKSRFFITPMFKLTKRQRELIMRSTDL